MGRWTKIIVILNCLAVLCGGTTALAAEQGKLAFMRGGNIWIAASDGGGARQLTHSRQDRGPCVSPDGKWVAYYSGRGEDSFGQIFLVPAAGGLVQQFRHPEVQGGEHPTFAPDGKSLLFVGLSDLNRNKKKGSESVQATMSLTLADLGRGAVRRLLSHPNTNLDTGYMYSNPAFSPDGRLIAYQESGSDVSGGFVVINYQQGKRLFRFPKKARDDTPCWRPQFSPDSQEMLCYSPATDSGKEDIIYLVRLASGQKTAVTLGSKPTYVDHGKAIVYERWPKERWNAGATVKADLWRLEPGVSAKMIIADAAEPAGQMP